MNRLERVLRGSTSQDLRRGSEADEAEAKAEVTFGSEEQKDLVRRRRGVAEEVGVALAEESMLERRSQRQVAQNPVMGLVVGWRSQAEWRWWDCCCWRVIGGGEERVVVGSSKEN